MPQTPVHIEVTEMLVRLYVFLTQYLDRCRDEALRQSYPDAELQAHLASTRSRLGEILSVNPVVKGKVEQECVHVLDVGAACLKGGSGALAKLGTERDVLRVKSVALSDVLAVFRAL